jgi:hypothetical protein
LVRLEFVDTQLLFPPLVIQFHQFHRRVLVGIQQTRQQPMDLLLLAACFVLQRVFDDAHHQAVSVLFAVVVVGIHLGQIRAVGQFLDGLDHLAALDTPQQMGLAGKDLTDVPVTEEVAVPQQQHVGLQPAHQVGGHAGLAAPARLEEPAIEDVAANLAQAKHANLREGPRGASRLRPPEGVGVGFCVSDIDLEAVESHQPHALVEGTGSIRLAEKFDDQPGEQTQSQDSQSEARLRDGVAGRSGGEDEGLQVLEDDGQAVGG